MCAVMEAENIWDLCLAQFRGALSEEEEGEGAGQALPPLVRPW